MAVPEPLRHVTPGDAGLRLALQELSSGRWQNIRSDLQTYLRKNATRILASPHFRRAMRLARVESRPMADLCGARDPRLDYALYLAAYGVLTEDSTIASRDEFTEQNAEIQRAVWILGVKLGRPPTPEEIRERIDLWLRESAAPQREKIVLIELLLMRADWAAYGPILWEALERGA